MSDRVFPIERKAPYPNQANTIAHKVSERKNLRENDHEDHPFSAARFVSPRRPCGSRRRLPHVQQERRPRRWAELPSLTPTRTVSCIMSDKHGPRARPAGHSRAGGFCRPPIRRRRMFAPSRLMEGPKRTSRQQQTNIQGTTSQDPEIIVPLPLCYDPTPNHRSWIASQNRKRLGAYVPTVPTFAWSIA